MAIMTYEEVFVGLCQVNVGKSLANSFFGHITFGDVCQGALSLPYGALTNRFGYAVLRLRVTSCCSAISAESLFDLAASYSYYA